MGRKKCKCGLTSPLDNSLFKFPLPPGLKYPTYPNKFILASQQKCTQYDPGTWRFLVILPFPDWSKHFFPPLINSLQRVVFALFQFQVLKSGNIILGKINFLFWCINWHWPESGHVTIKKIPLLPKWNSSSVVFLSLSHFSSNPGS